MDGNLGQQPQLGRPKYAAFSEMFFSAPPGWFRSGGRFRSGGLFGVLGVREKLRKKTYLDPQKGTCFFAHYVIFAHFAN